VLVTHEVDIRFGPGHHFAQLADWCSRPDTAAHTMMGPDHALDRVLAVILEVQPHHRAVTEVLGVERPGKVGVGSRSILELPPVVACDQSQPPAFSWHQDL